MREIFGGRQSHWFIKHHCYERGLTGVSNQCQADLNEGTIEEVSITLTSNRARKHFRSNGPLNSIKTTSKGHFWFRIHGSELINHSVYHLFQILNVSSLSNELIEVLSCATNVD